MMDEWWIRKDLEGSGRGLMWVLTCHFPGGTQRNHTRFMHRILFYAELYCRASGRCHRSALQRAVPCLSRALGTEYCTAGGVIGPLYSAQSRVYPELLDWILHSGQCRRPLRNTAAITFSCLSCTSCARIGGDVKIIWIGYIKTSGRLIISLQCVDYEVVE